MTRQSIIFVTQFFPPYSSEHHTGGTISNRRMLWALSEFYDIVILSFDSSDDSQIFDNEPFTVVHRPAPKLRAPGLIHRWLDFVRTETRSVIESHSIPAAIIATTSSLAAFDVAPPGTRRIAVVRAYENFGPMCPWIPPRERVSLAKLAIVRRFQDGRLMRSADAILTNSQFMRAAVSKRFAISPEKVHVLLQFADVSGTLLPAPNNTVGFVNRGSVKNLPFLLELAQLSPDLRYVIYGQKSGLPQNLPQNVTFCGWCANRSEMFASAAVWIVPSLWAEPFGRVSIEAQAANRAVLVADTGGLPETVTDSRFRIAGFSHDAWLERIRKLMTLPVSELEQNGMHVRRAYSQERHGEIIMKTIERILAHQREYRIA